MTFCSLTVSAATFLDPGAGDLVCDNQRARVSCCPVLCCGAGITAPDPGAGNLVCNNECARVCCCAGVLVCCRYAYSADQLEYHYTKNKEVLKRAVEALKQQQQQL